MPSLLSKAAVPPVEISSMPSSAKTPCKGGDAGLIGDTEERAVDCRHGKALFLHVPETLLNVRRYTSMEDLRSPAFCFS